MDCFAKCGDFLCMRSRISLRKETNWFWAANKYLKSAVSDHYKRNRHIMDWVKAKLIGSDINNHKCWITEAVEIRKRANGTVNMLSHTWVSSARGHWNLSLTE